MNLTAFAPKEFKEHLKELENTIAFNRKRHMEGLGYDNPLQHYVITGNEGVGIDDAVKRLYNLVADAYGIGDCERSYANEMFDSSGGFEESMKEACHDNTIIFIKNAEDLILKSNVNPKNGMEELCDRMGKLKNSIVILTGKRNRLMELVQGNDKAKVLFTNVFHFDDLTPEYMMQYMTDYCNEKNYMFTLEAEEKLRTLLGIVYRQRGTNFRNSIYLDNLFDREIVPRMAQRVVNSGNGNENANGNDNENVARLCAIMPEDIPEMKVPNVDEAIAKLKSMVGLEEIKKQIIDHTALVKLNRMRAEKELYNSMPPMHMVFTGNPGTGKTTIAKYIGEIYHSIGVLSSGHVVSAERSKLVGEYIGETEKKTLATINSAAGGVLFIDEAYSLVDDPQNKKDYGMRVIETLLTFLSAEETDMIIILAGYTNEMKQMLESNPGLKSRFPYIFHFDDYTPDQLMQIGKMVLEEEHYRLSAEAEKKLSRCIVYEYDNKDEHFGNGRFVTRLIKSHIIPALSRRLLSKPADELSIDDMTTVEACDIPDPVEKEGKPQDMDEALLTEAMEKLNNLVGLRNAKQALRDYATVSRMSHQQGILKITPQNLCWDFIGKTGTGKSTVAEILGKIMHGLGILKRGHTICINAEELIGGDSYQVLERVTKEASDGLLFLDMDAPNTSNINMNHIKMWILNKIKENHQVTALVVAQLEAPEDMIAQNLATHGIASYGNSVVFDDYSKQELFEILSYMLNSEYHLGIEPEAYTIIKKYIENIKSSETKNSPVNARTIMHLSQTIAHVTQLRLAKSGGERMVTVQDVSQFKWDGKAHGRVGFV